MDDQGENISNVKVAPLGHTLDPGGSVPLVLPSDISMLAASSRHMTQGGHRASMVPKGEVPGNGEGGTADEPLEEQLTNEKLRRLERIFEEADEDGGGGLDMEEFRHAMRQTMGVHVTDEDLDMIFMKVDTNCDGTVDWDEYLTYMLLECREKDSMSVQARQPFTRDVRRFKGENRDSIVRILIIPQIVQSSTPIVSDSQVEQGNGKYLMASREGVVTILSMTDKEQPTTHRIQPSLPHTSLWVTDLAYMPRSHTLAASNTNREILFYEVANDKFKLISRITGLQSCPVAMTFWSHPKKAKRGFLLWGDDRGGISALVFEKPLIMTPLHPKYKSGRTRYAFGEALAGKVEHLKAYYLPGIHNETVRQVMYAEYHAGFLSCSHDSHTAMYLGDLEQKLMKSYFKVMKGINSFDFCERFNIIASGGNDGIVRIWNPYVPGKPILLLRGHKSPILHVHINTIKDHIISLAENKEIRIHDLNTQTCIQTFYRNMLCGFGPRPMTASLFNTNRQSLLFATTMLGILEHKEEELKHQMVTSHKKAVTVVLYNSLFKQVVSAAVNSQVCVWSITTGEKVMQFTAHTMRLNGRFLNVEVTAMTFDPTYRRLITAGRDGTVKVWNFNNGAMLRQLPSTNTSYVTSLVCPAQRIVTAGWDRKVTVYIDDVDDDSYNVLRPESGEDIQTLALLPPNTIAAGSQDGDIMVWSLDIMRPTLNFSTSTKKSMGPVHIQKLLCCDTRPTDSDIKDSASNESGHRVKFPEGPFLPPLDEEKYMPKRFKIQGVSKLLFLQAREPNRRTGTLVVACQDGLIQFWSMSHDDGMLGQFFAAHDQGDYVHCMVASNDNEFLVTGDSLGYIRVWDISHYCVAGKECTTQTDNERNDIWAQFTYTKLRSTVVKNTRRKTLRPFEGAGLLTKGSGAPHLINSVRGHLKAVTSIDLAELNDKSLIVSASSDCSVRLWSIHGEFLGIFGQATLWANVKKYLSYDRLPIPHLHRYILLPPDIRRVASATTLRVLNLGPNRTWIRARLILRWLAGFAANREKEEEEEEEAEEATEEPQTEPEQVSSDLKNLPPKTRWDTSKILGKTYKRSTHYHLPPELPSPVSQASRQCSAFRSLPIQGSLDDLSSTDCLHKNPLLTEIQQRYHLPPLGPRPERKMTFAKVIAITQATRAMKSMWKSAAPRESGNSRGRSSTDSGRKRLSERRPSIFMSPQQEAQKGNENTSTKDTTKRSSIKGPKITSQHS